ncbi:MAG: proteasome subunit beta [Candidatus Micrarchaeia archaeon]
MDDREIAGKVLKGTTIIGILCSDGVVIGADSRATMDSFIASSEAFKIFKIDEKLAIAMAGVVGDAEYMAKLLKAQNDIYKMEEGVPLNPTSATSLLHVFLQENKMAFPFLGQLVVGGFNRDTPELYSIGDYIGSYTKETKFTSIGSGSPMALSYLDDAYRKNITTQDAIKLAVKALKLAMKRDSATGDKIKIVLITKNGYKDLTDEEIEKLAK